MRIVRTDKMACERPKQFRWCWRAIVVWMVACVANACFSFSLLNQGDLDGWGFIILCIGIVLMLTTFKFRSEAENRWESLRFNRIGTVTMGSHPGLERFIEKYTAYVVAFLLYVAGPGILI